MSLILDALNKARQLTKAGRKSSTEAENLMRTFGKGPKQPGFSESKKLKKDRKFAERRTANKIKEWEYPLKAYEREGDERMIQVATEKLNLLQSEPETFWREELEEGEETLKYYQKMTEEEAMAKGILDIKSRIALQTEYVAERQRIIDGLKASKKDGKRKIGVEETYLENEIQNLEQRKKEEVNELGIVKALRNEFDSRSRSDVFNEEEKAFYSNKLSALEADPLNFIITADVLPNEKREDVIKEIQAVNEKYDSQISRLRREHFGKLGEKTRRKNILRNLVLAAGLGAGFFGTGLGLSYFAKKNADRDSGKTKVGKTDIEHMTKEEKQTRIKAFGFEENKEDGNLVWISKVENSEGEITKIFPGGKMEIYKDGKLTQTLQIQKGAEEQEWRNLGFDIRVIPNKEAGKIENLKKDIEKKYR